MSSDIYCVVCQRSHQPPVAIAVNDHCPQMKPNAELSWLRHDLKRAGEQLARHRSGQ